MKRVLTPILAVLLLAVPLKAQDNWLSPGLLTASVGTPITANQVFADAPVNDLATDVRVSITVIVASTVIAAIAVQKVDSLGVVLKEQAMIVPAMQTFKMDLALVVFPGEHLRIVNKTPLTVGLLWPSLIMN